MDKKQYKLLGILTALYITFQLISDVTAGKIIVLFGFTVSVTALYFPFTYILADVLTEVYGYSQSRRIVWLVLLCSILAGIFYMIVAYLPPAVGFDGNDAYVRVFSSVPRILLGGWIAVWAGGILNDYVLAKMKVRTQGKHLRTRTIGSTIVGEGANTFLFYIIALYGILPNSLLVSSILSGRLIKVLVETILTPVTYLIIHKIKKIEHEDYYDKNTDFNPFKIS